jgi:large subunit ribosomal protein L15
MKLHDLKPAPGSRKPRRRVGRGIAAGQGKTAGRGTKGQKARAGGSIPAWFEGGQTPLHQRIPKLHGFRNPFRIEYEVVNIGSIAHLVELGVLESGEMPGTPAKRAKATPAPVTVNQEILRAAGLVRTLDRPMKILGNGELSTALFVVADRFSASAKAKIEAAGGSVSVLEVPKERTAAVGVTAEPGAGKAKKAKQVKAAGGSAADASAPDEAPAEAVAASHEPPTPAASAKADAVTASAEPAAPEAEASAGEATEAAAEAPIEKPAAAPKARAPRRPKAAKPDAEA